MKPDLLALFTEINRQHFDGFLEPPEFRWNSRLRSSAGRFIPGSRKFWGTGLPQSAPIIEVALYLTEEAGALDLIRDTVAHEMIHYWLWVRRRPYGHTPEFYLKMNEMGVSRYNSVPRVRPYKYVYACLGCRKEFFARRRLGPLACADCCKRHGGGKYDSRFKLVLARKPGPAETPQRLGHGG